MGSTVIEPRQRGVNPDSLSDQQLVFCNELAADSNFNATAAARRAGYKNPSSSAGKLLKQTKVQGYLGKVLGDRIRRCEVDADRVLSEVSYCALRDPLDLCDENGQIIVDDLRKIPEEARRAIDGVRVKRTVHQDGTVEDVIELKLVSKIAALELAMKHLGLLAPKQHEVRHTLDWDALYGEGEVVDTIEARIEKR